MYSVSSILILERFEITILTKTHFFQMVYNTRHNSKTLGMIFRCINAFPDWAFAISSFFYVSPRNMTLPQYDHQNQQLKDSKWKHSIIWHRFPREYDKKIVTIVSSCEKYLKMLFFLNNFFRLKITSVSVIENYSLSLDVANVMPIL